MKCWNTSTTTNLLVLYIPVTAAAI